MVQYWKVWNEFSLLLFLCNKDFMRGKSLDVWPVNLMVGCYQLAIWKECALSALTTPLIIFLVEPYTPQQYPSGCCFVVRDPKYLILHWRILLEKTRGYPKPTRPNYRYAGRSHGRLCSSSSFTSTQRQLKGICLISCGLSRQRKIRLYFWYLMKLTFLVYLWTLRKFATQS